MKTPEARTKKANRGGMINKCDLCGKTFKYFDDLYWHLEVDHELYPYDDKNEEPV